MTDQVATIRDDLSFRQIVAFSILRWNLKLGFAVAPRDISRDQLRRRKRVRRPTIPSRLCEDVGLPREEVYHPVNPAEWPLLK